jgi:hypothetical protein
MATADVVHDMGQSLYQLLRSNIDASIVGDIQLSTPEQFEDLPDVGRTTLTIFLYRVSISSEMRNMPRRTLPDGRTTRPPLPIELRYLITPWASSPASEYFMAGHVMRALYDHAEMGPPFLVGSSWNTNDSVQVILETLPIEDHTRIWDTVRKPYRLSLTYMVRVVGIDPDVAFAQNAPPIVSASFGALP